MNKQIDKVIISVKDVIISHKLKSKIFNKLWHIDEFWEDPKDDDIIVCEYEDHHMEVEKVTSDLDTDEIIRYAYLNDLL